MKRFTATESTFRRCWKGSFLTCRLVLCSALAAASGMPASAQQAPRSGDDKTAIEWEADWGRTYTTNRQRWEKELGASVSGWQAHDQELRRRLSALLESLLEKYPDLKEKHVPAHGELADYAFWLGEPEKACEFLKKVVEEGSGQMAAVEAALQTLMIRGTDSAWKEYAAMRIVALYRAGLLLKTDANVRSAWALLVNIRKSQGRIFEAGELLEEWGEAVGRDVMWRFEKAKICYENGSYETEKRFADLMGEIGETHIDPDARNVWKSIHEYRTWDNRCPYVESSLNYRPGRVVPVDAPVHMSALDRTLEWAAVRTTDAGGIPEKIDLLIKESADSRLFITSEANACATDLWGMIDRRLRSQDPAQLAALRDMQEKQCRVSGGESSAAEDVYDERFAVFRRYPWSVSAHKRLMEYAWESLWSGRAGFAARSFEDVLAHSANAADRAEAQSGLWLALGQAHDRARLELSFRSIDPGMKFPWMGKTESARTIRSQLLDRVPAQELEAAPGLRDLKQSVIKIQAVPAWPVTWHMDTPEGFQGYTAPRVFGDAVLGALPFPDVGLQFNNGSLLVSSPNILAWYGGGNTDRPEWSRVVTGTTSQFRRATGIFRPAVAGGRIYTRWGYERRPTEVAALDAGTGRQIWSTAGHRSLGKDEREPSSAFWPASDPVCSAGRVYYLAMTFMERSEMIYLLCRDADTGALLWKSRIADENMFFVPHQPGEDGLIDLAMYGNAVTENEGALYCAANVGIVARCDARDGRVEWAHRYPRTGTGGRLPAWGSSPLVLGGKLVLAPRDYRGMFALDCGAGRLLWQNPFVQPREIMGNIGDNVIVYERKAVASVDAVTGKVAWYQWLGEDVAGHGRVAGASVYAATARTFFRLDAASGIIREQMACDAGRTVQNYGIGGGGLCIVSDEACGTGDLKTAGAGAQGDMQAGQAQDLFPLTARWEIGRPNCRIFQPQPEDGLDDRVYLYSDGILECARLNARGAVDWQRFVPTDLDEVFFESGKVIMRHTTRLTAFDGATGAVRWRTEFSSGYTVNQRIGSRYHVVGTGGWFAVVDLATGKTVWDKMIRGLNWAVPCWDGKDLHLVGSAEDSVRDFVCDLMTGRVLTVHKVLTRDDGQLQKVVFADGASYCFMSKDWKTHFYRYALDGKPPAKRAGEIPSHYLHAAAGPYLMFLMPIDYLHRDKTQAIVRMDDPSYDLRFATTNSPPVIREGRVYAKVQDGVQVIDLNTRKEVLRYSIPGDAGRQAHRVPAFLIRGKEEMFILSGNRELRLDLFDLQSGRHKGGQALDGISYKKWATPVDYGAIVGRQYWENEILFGSGVVLVTDGTGAHGLSPTGKDEKPAAVMPVEKVYPVSQPIAIDGSLGEWNREDCSQIEFETRASGGKKGRILLARDAFNLYAAVAYEDAQIDPFRGHDAYGDGDRLSIGLRAAAANNQWRIGLDDGGRVVCEGAPPAGTRTRIQHDMATLEHVYELSIPFREKTSVLSIEVHDDRGREGPVQVVNRTTRLISVDKITRREEEIMLDIVRQLPGLPEASAYRDRLKEAYTSLPQEFQVLPPVKQDLDPKHAVEVIGRHVVRLGKSQLGYELCRILMRLDAVNSIPQDMLATMEIKREGPFALSDAGFIRNWLVLGPFPNQEDNGEWKGLDTDYLSGSHGEHDHVSMSGVQVTTPSGGKVKWASYASDKDVIDFVAVKHLGLNDENLKCVVYAAAILECDQDMEVDLGIGADDGYKAFFDRQNLGVQNVFRSVGADQEKYHLKLTRGMHSILVKVDNKTMGTSLMVHLMSPGGGKPGGVRVWN